jgi:type IV pilus assembly protein PilY1
VIEVEKDMKPLMTQHCKLAVAVMLFSSGLAPFGLSQAALLDIANIPLFIGSTGVAPNVFITLDDSGSMDWEFTTNKHWQANFYDYAIVNGSLDNVRGSSGVPTDNVAGSQKRWYGYGTDSSDSSYAGSQSIMFSYYYHTSDNIYAGGSSNVCESGDGNGRAIYNCNRNYTLWRPDKRTNPVTQQTGILWDWRVFSADLNTLYYSPGASYQPWVGLTENASYTAARSNPKSNSPTAGTDGYTVLRNLSNEDFYYAVWNDNKGFAGTRPGRGDNAASDSTSTTDGHMTSVPNSYVDLWDNYTLYTVKAGATDTITVQTFKTETCKTETSFPNLTTVAFNALTGTGLDKNDKRCYYYCTSSTINRTDTCDTPSNFQYRYQKGLLVVSQVGSTTTLTGAGAHSELNGKTIAQVKQNIANWYQYYRKRSFVAKGALAKVITAFPNFRYGISVLNEWSGSWPSKLFIQMPTSATPPFTAHNESLIQKMYGFDWDSNSTPLQSAHYRAGQYFENLLSGKPTPILSAAQGGECQQNFALLTTDGFWNEDFTATGNIDGDGYSNTVADVAKYYYSRDLSATLANKVITTPFDYANHQHMVTFTVGFGVEGNFSYPTTSGWPDELSAYDGTDKESADWGNPDASDNSPAKIDDLWHAAYNGRGAFVSARNPDELVEGSQQCTQRYLVAGWISVGIVTERRLCNQQ